MKKKRILLVLVGVGLIVGGYYIYRTIKHNKAEREHRAWVATLEPTASANVHYLEDTILVDYLDAKRTLAIYLPDGYEGDSVDYPVIYFLDGQSPFCQKVQEGTEWQVDEHLDSLSRLGGQKSIVVAIYNSEDRNREYKPFPSTRIYSDRRNTHGDKHAQWIVDKLKPWVDARYRTKRAPEFTVIGGASLSGLLSYYMAMEYPEVFGGAIVFSPSFWVNEIVYTLHEDNTLLNQQKIFFNAGELEVPTVNSIVKMRDILLEHGMPPENMLLEVEEGEGHWHMSWQKGFKKVYPWIVER